MLSSGRDNACLVSTVVKKNIVKKKVERLSSSFFLEKLVN